MVENTLAFPTSGWHAILSGSQWHRLPSNKKPFYRKAPSGYYHLKDPQKSKPNGGALAPALPTGASTNPFASLTREKIEKFFPPVTGQQVTGIRSILKDLPGFETSIYRKQMEEASKFNKLRAALALAQRGFAAAGATPKRGESPFATVSRELLSPLAGDLMTVAGEQSKLTLASKLAEQQAKAKLSSTAFQVATSRNDLINKGVFDAALAAGKNTGLNLTHKYGVNITLDSDGTKAAANNANVVIMTDKKNGATAIRTVGDVKGTGPNKESIIIGSGSLVKGFGVYERGENIKTKFAENVVMEGFTTHNGDKVPFVTIGNAYIQARSKKGGRPVQTLLGSTQATITLLDGTTKDVVLKDGTVIDSYHKYTEPKDTLTQWFNPTNRDIILPYLFRGEEIQKRIRPGESNAITIRQDDINRILDKNPIAMDKLRKVPAQTAISTEKKTYVNTGPDALIIGNKTIKPNGIISISPRALQQFPDHVFRNLKPVGKPTRESSTVYIKRPDEDAELVEKVVVSPANPEQPSIVLHYDNKGKKIPKGTFKELTDTHNSPTVTEKLTVKPGIFKKVSKALGLEIAAGDEIEIRTSAAKGGTGLDDIKEYWIFGKKLNSRIVENLIKANSFQTRALTKEQAIEAGDVSQFGPEKEGVNLIAKPDKIQYIAGVLGVSPERVTAGDVFKVRRSPSLIEGEPDKVVVSFQGEVISDEKLAKLREANVFQSQTLSAVQKVKTGQDTQFLAPTRSKLQVTASDPAALKAVNAIIPGALTGAEIDVIRTEPKPGSDEVATIKYTYAGVELPFAAVQALTKAGHLKTPGALTMPQKREAKLADEPQPQQTKLFFNPTAKKIGNAQPGGFANWTPKDLDNLTAEEKTKVLPFDSLGPTTVFTAKVDGDNIGEEFDFMGGKLKGGQSINLANLDLAGMKEADRKLFTTRFVSGESASKREVRKVDLNNAFKQYQIDTKAPSPSKNLTGSQLSNLFGQFPSTRAINQSKLREAFQRLIPAETGKMATTEKAYGALLAKGYVSTVPWAELPYIDRAAWARVPRDVYSRDQQQINAAFEKQYKILEATRDKFNIPSTEDQANFSQTARMYTLLGRAKELLGETGIFEGILSKVFATLGDWVPGNDQEIELKSIFQEFESKMATFADDAKNGRMTNWRLQLIQTNMPKFTSPELLNRASVNKAMQILEDNLQNQFSITQQQNNYIGPGFAATLVAHGIKPETPVDTTKYTWADPALAGRPFSTKVKTLMALGGKLFTRESFDKLSPGALVLTTVKDKPEVMFLKVDPKTLDPQLHPKCTEDRCVIQTRDGNSPAPGAEAINFNMK